MASIKLNAAWRCLFRAPVYVYRWKCGWLLGHRFILLIHSGRRSGRRHLTVLEVMAYRSDGPEVVVMSAFGRNANWFRNIRATPNPCVVSGSRRFTATFRILDPDEAVGVIAHYERRNWFVAPLIRLVLSRLLGWRYAGTEADRRRLAAQLPLVAFRPR